jgi:hypothetical protein
MHTSSPKVKLMVLLETFVGRKITIEIHCQKAKSPAAAAILRYHWTSSSGTSLYRESAF